MRFETKCRFPILVFYPDGQMGAYESLESFATSTRANTKGGEEGYFIPSTIFDSNDMAWMADGGTKSRASWVYRLFRRQPVRVKLTIIGKPQAADLTTLKSRVVQRLLNHCELTITLKNLSTAIKSHVAVSLVSEIQIAASVSQIIDKIIHLDFPERHQWRVD